MKNEKLFLDSFIGKPPPISGLSLVSLPPSVTNSGGGGQAEAGGNNTWCELTIEGAEIADNGQWTCALTDNNMDTVKHHRELRVEEGETEELEMMAGETLEVVCSLEEAWP